MGAGASRDARYSPDRDASAILILIVATANIVLRRIIRKMLGRHPATQAAINIRRSLVAR